MSTPDITPDLAGFTAAQASLRTFFGRDVRFYGPADVIYDPTVPLSEFDDEGFPMDPLVAASATNLANIEIANLTIVGSAHCNVLFQPLAAMRRDELGEDELGFSSILNKDLLMDIADFPQASGATYFMVGTFERDTSGAIVYVDPPNDDGSNEAAFEPDDGELWKVVQTKVDGLGAIQRYVVFGQGTL
jgi:hypothetical protein